jgi:hypothetical protein
MKRIPLPVLLFGGFAALFPFFVSRRLRVAVSLLIQARPERIFPLLNDLHQWPRWTVWTRRRGLHFAYEGAESGAGAVQKWHGCCTNGVLTLTHSVPNDHVSYDLSLGAGRYRLEGMLRIEPFEGLSRVSWICAWHASSEPYRRYGDLFLRWRLNRDFVASLRQLRTLAESSTEV